MISTHYELAQYACNCALKLKKKYALKTQKYDVTWHGYFDNSHAKLLMICL